MRVTFHPQARDELRHAVKYYDEEARGLGRQLVNEIRRVVTRIADLPKSGSPMGSRRRVVLRRFPFTLVYREQADTLQVLALAHHRRRPGYWRHRR